MRPPSAPHRRRAVLLPCVVAGVLLVLSSCRVDTTVGVDVGSDGSGTVTVVAELDAAAATELGPVDGVVLGDLDDAGWEVEEPDDSAGGLRLSVTRRFDSPDDLGAVLAEVGGGERGVFRDVELEVDPSVDRTSYRFGARIVLTGDPSQFSDGDLTEALGGLPLGRTPEELALLGADDPGAGTLLLRVRLPGGAPETDGRVVDGAAEWSFPLTGGDATDETVSTSSQDVDRRTTVLLLVAAGLAVLAPLALVVGLLRRRRRR